MNTMHVIEFIPAYVLGILPDDEREGVSKHLERCLSCQVELHAYQSVVDHLPQTVSQHNPPQRLRAAILQKAAAQEISAQPARPSWWAWLSRPLNPLVGLVGLLVIVALAGLNILQMQQAQHPAVSSATAVPTNFHLVKLAPPQGTGPTGMLVISDDGNFGTLVVDGLTVLNSNQQYQLWLVKDGKRTSGGVFSVEASGYGMMQVDSPQPLNTYQSFGITVEPFGGSPGPTGQKVLGGNL